MSQPNPQKFRYDINALRAISVIGVLLFHYKVAWVGGGFAGVDVFFVISGYLMSKIIINGLNRDNFSLAEFYGRRLKRIVPALLALVLVLTVGGLFIYFPDSYQLNQRNAAASVLFVSNIVYWQSAGYFAEASDTNIFPRPNVHLSKIHIRFDNFNYCRKIAGKFRRQIKSTHINFQKLIENKRQIIALMRSECLEN